MSSLKKVAIFGASGNFGTPITSALTSAGGFEVTIITRLESKSSFPPGLPVVRTAYTVEDLTKVLTGQDAVVCVVGPAGIDLQVAMVDAAEAAGVRRFIIDDFGWGPTNRGLPEFQETIVKRRRGWDHAAARAEANQAFTWTGISTGNPIDWALKKFPPMGFNVNKHVAIIYDAGNEMFSGTTLEGIGQSVVGVLRHPDETANRFVKVRSINTCQNELLRGFEAATGTKWEVQRSNTETLKRDGKEKMEKGIGGWTLLLAVAQLLDPGMGRNVVAPSREDSDSDLLGVAEETPESIAVRVMNS